MELIIKKTIGSTVYPFTVSGKNLHECVMESQKLSFPNVDKCGCCGSDDLYLSAHVAESFKYTEIRCNKCRAELTFGLRKDDSDVSFLRRNEDGSLAWKKFTPETTEPTGPKSAPPVQDPPTPPAKQQHTQQAQQPARNQPKANNAPKTNAANKTHRYTKPLADTKPTSKALNFAMKLSTAGDEDALNSLAAIIKHDPDFMSNETDRKYLQTEYMRKYYSLKNAPAIMQ